jgi:hypothetical protein
VPAASSIDFWELHLNRLSSARLRRFGRQYPDLIANKFAESLLIVQIHYYLSYLLCYNRF